MRRRVYMRGHGSSLRHCRVVKNTRIDDRTGSGNGAEGQLRPGDRRDEKGLILIEPSRGDRRRGQATLPELAARADDEVRDALLRLDPLVDVFVAREHDVDAVIDE